jgi:hypothetical protein
MSLVNDVLRQVDSRSNVKDEISSFLPVALIPKNNRNISKLFFMIVSGFLILIYIVQLVMNKPLFSHAVAVTAPASFVSDKNYNAGIDIIAITDLPQKPELIHVSEKLVTPVETVASVEVVASVQVMQEKSVQSLPPKSKAVKSKATKPQAIKSQAIKSQATNSQPVSAKVDNSMVIKAQNKIEGEKEYQQALSYFISGNIKKSDYMLKQALLKNSSEKYLSLQARIFIKQKDADSFYRLVKTYPENNSLDWYKLIAPGLQLFSYYHLSNQYYYALIKIEPEQVRWQLAVALNQLRLGKEDKAIAIYRELSQSAQVSSQQKQWLIRKIERLTLSKA